MSLRLNYLSLSFSLSYFLSLPLSLPLSLSLSLSLTHAYTLTVTRLFAKSRAFFRSPPPPIGAHWVDGEAALVCIKLPGLKSEEKGIPKLFRISTIPDQKHFLLFRIFKTICSPPIQKERNVLEICSLPSCFWLC